jgi:murein DD-endopeptidase MepM/ murein hydrolase activator NlpD
MFALRSEHMLTPQMVSTGPTSQLSIEGARPPTIRRSGVLLALAAAVIVAALLVLGLHGLIGFGLLVALSADADEEGSRRSVVLNWRNLALATAVVAAFAWFWLWHLASAESTLVLVGGALMALPLALQDAADTAAAGRVVAVTKRSLIVALWALVVFVELYYALGQSFNMVATVCVVLPLVLAASRARAGRRGQVELGLLRHALGREVRPHLVQGLNVWLCCALLAGVLAAGGTHFARIAYSLTGVQHSVMIAAFTVGLLLLATLALVPRRRVYVATNVVVALLSGFLAVQLAQVSVGQSNAVVLDSPLVGEWFVLNGGHSVLLNGHSPNESNAVDFLRLGANGRTHTGGTGAPVTGYAGFGWPVLAPADGRIVEMTDGYPDNPPGTNGDHANHLLIDIGGGRYVSMAHLKQGSVTVDVGDVVNSGQPLAAVGNNGHSSEPHLHLQVQDSPADADADHTYPMVFRNVDITRGGAWPWGDIREPRTGDLVQGLRP